MPEVGEEGQERLRAATVAIVGLGGLGSLAAELLCRAGVGSLILLDYDVVELSNLQRQSLYTEQDIGKPKATTAKEHLSRIDAAAKIDAHATQLSPSTANLLDEAELLLDCTDNLATRFLLNEYAMSRAVPFVSCGAVETRCMLYVTDPRRRERACFACIFDSLHSVENCEDAGVLNVTVHLGATLQTAEALKLLLGKEYTEEFISADAWEPRLERFTVKKKSSCRVCGGAYDLLEGRGKRITFCTTKRCVKVRPNDGRGVSLETLKERFEVVEEFGASGVRLKVDGIEVLVFPYGGLEIGTRDRDVANRIADRIYQKRSEKEGGEKSQGCREEGHTCDPQG